MSRRPPGRRRGSPSRRLALDVLRRVEDDGAYANLALRRALDRSSLSRRDRAMVTDLVYGVTRMRRACDWLVDRFLLQPVEPAVRRALRLGAYELVFNRAPPHAAVGETVGVAPARARGLVNAVLRKVADAGTDPDALPWPDPATRLSYPDHIVERLVADLGEERAWAALAAMNEPAQVTVRDDGYVQDLASQWVTDIVGAAPGETVVDLCAGPGGKATGMAHTGAAVVALDAWDHRARLVGANADRVGAGVAGLVVADGRRPPLRPASVDRVLVDAPCTGLGVLRRRADARWRVGADDHRPLADLQVDLVRGGWDLVRPGGVLVYAVCTLTAAETTEVVAEWADGAPDLELLPPPGPPWIPWGPEAKPGPERPGAAGARSGTGQGALLLPQAEATDGMFVVAARRHVARADLR